MNVRRTDCWLAFHSSILRGGRRYFGFRQLRVVTSRKIEKPNVNPFPLPGIPHGAPLGRRTRPEAAHAAPEVLWYVVAPHGSLALSKFEEKKGRHISDSV